MTLPSLDSLASRIRHAHEQCRATFSAGLDHAVSAGKLLMQAKETIPHGDWLSWLATNCPDISDRLAQKYMQVARELPRLQAADPANTPRVADLSFRAALEIVAVNAQTARKIPEADRPEVIEAAAEEKLANLTEAREKYVSRSKRKRAQFRAAPR